MKGGGVAERGIDVVVEEEIESIEEGSVVEEEEVRKERRSGRAGIDVVVEEEIESIEEGSVVEEEEVSKGEEEWPSLRLMW